MKNARHVHLACLGLLFLIFAALLPPAIAQQPHTAAVAAPPLSADQIVQNLVRMNLERAQALLAYQGTRYYRVAYRGFPGTRSAEMVVEVKYRSPGTKEFTIQSETGSKLIIDKVFKKLLQSEKEALEAENQRHLALNNDNYIFTPLGYETSPAGCMHVLSVEPRTKSKFLYRGTIWVDAEDFAVVRIKAQPAKNPSFWTKNTEVEQVYAKVGGFWLPAHNRSVTTIRLGGHAFHHRLHGLSGHGREPIDRVPQQDCVGQVAASSPTRATLGKEKDGPGTCSTDFGRSDRRGYRDEGGVMCPQV